MAHKSTPALTGAILAIALAASAAPAALTFSFDDGTLQGWTSIMEGAFVDRGDSPGNEQTMGVFRYDVVDGTTAFSNSPTIGEDLPAGAQAAYSGDHYIGNLPFYLRDSGTSSLLIRSPEFQLDASNELTVSLRGGAGSAATLVGTSAALPTTTSAVGFQGVALRRVDTDTYLASARRSADGDSWETVTIDQATIAAIAAANPGAAFTLDLVDTRDGGWGWTSLDHVSLPTQLTASNQIIGVTATASSFEPGLGREPIHAVDGSGLSPSATAIPQHVDASNSVVWNSAAGDSDPWFKADLGDVYSVDLMRLWNYNDSFGNVVNRSILEADVWGSLTGVGTPDSDPGDWFLIIDNQGFAKAPGSPDYNTPDDVALGGVLARYILLDDMVNYGPDGFGNQYGIAEIQFFVSVEVPAPASLPAGLALLAFAATHRRRRA